MSTAFFEHSYYIGNYMSGILYGVELVLYCMTMSNLLKAPSRRQSRKTLMAYSTTLLFLLTIDASTNAVWGEQMWITFRDQPGGVPAFIANDLSVWYQALGSSSAVALVFLGDALLIYRCFILLGSNFWIIIVPVLMYTAAFILSVLELVASFVPHGFFLASKATQFGTPYYALTISMNALVTLLICSRLFTLRRQMRTSMGIERAQLYTNVIAIMVESAAPYSIFGIMFLVPYARGSAIAVAFGQVWAKLTCIAPQLIVLRVTAGKAWDRDTMTQATSTVVFKQPTQASIPISELSNPYGPGTTLGESPSEQWESEGSSKGSVKGR